MSDQIKEIKQEIRELKSKLVAQEHRLLPSLMNMYDAIKTKANRKEAVTAIIWNILLRTPTIVTITGAGILSAYLAFKANQILENQNRLIEKQNSLITYQNKLTEAERRANLIPELSRVLDQVSDESRVNDNSNESLRLSPALEARTIALSKALRPYYFLDYGDELSQHERSPERGQLLLALAEANVDMSNLLKKADFSRSLLPRIKMENKNFSEGQLTYIDADGCYFFNCNFSKSNLHGARFLGGDMVKCNLSNAKFMFTNFGGTRFQGTDFSGANFASAKLTETYNFQNCNFQNASFHEAFVSDSTWLDEMHNLIKNQAIFDRSKYRLKAFSGDRKVDIEKLFDYLRHDLTEKIYQIEHLDSIGSVGHRRL